MSTTDSRQMTGKIEYPLGLTAVIDLDQDKDFRDLDDATRRSMIRRLAYKMTEYAAEFFDEYADVHKVTRPDDDDEEQALYDLLLGAVKVAKEA